MSTDCPRPNVNQALSGLKDFQMRTVDAVFQRMYLDENPTRRFLIADEVGLGKTMVARGLIAKAIDHLWETVPRIDIVYICSSREIAKQNIARLNFNPQQDFALPDRITELARFVHGLQSRKTNFVAFTPGTSFDLKSSEGRAVERALLYRLLHRHWNFTGMAPINVLQCGCGAERFRWLCHETCRINQQIDPEIQAAFLAQLDQEDAKSRARGVPGLRDRFDRLCEVFARKDSRVSDQHRRERRHVIGELRELLAAVSLEALKPDLIILDEFQRFKDLLSGDSPAARLAQNLFDFAYEAQESSARVLLLSATPYKMYTLHEESDTDDHYQDFHRTLGFLLGDENLRQQFQRKLGQFQDNLLAGGDGAIESLRGIKLELETILRRVMVRTERLGITQDRNGMLREVVHTTGVPQRKDLLAYLEMEAWAKVLNQPSMITFWKSAPFLLNFMDEYALKRSFNRALLQEDASQLKSQLDHQGDAWLNRDDLARYLPLDPAHAKMRMLLEDTVAKTWRHLWVPPSLPYYPLEGAYADSNENPATKRLIFSSWKVVPKAIAALLSYEAERRAIRSLDPEAINTPEEREKRRPLLRFAYSNQRLTGLPILSLVLPSFSLAELTDPLQIRSKSSPPLTLSEMRDIAMQAIRERLDKINVPLLEERTIDERWYWIAPFLLDDQENRRRLWTWTDQPNLAERLTKIGENPLDAEPDPEGRWADHVRELCQVLNDFREGRLALGPQPENLVEVLCTLGMGGIGNCMLRSFRMLEGGTLDACEMRNIAAACAHGALSYFNTPESISIIRGLDPRKAYWLSVARYNMQGGLQSVLDEYTALLCESRGLAYLPPEKRFPHLAEALLEVLTLRTALVKVDHVSQTASGAWEPDPATMRVHYAMRYGADREDQGGGSSRAEHVRAAFNSPFRPFVLATTSIGQEGLDFHTYCHAIVHWNLPGNPVDFEQREGRVHRYKGHAVRKNAAKVFLEGMSFLADHPPWKIVFEFAEQCRRFGQNDLIPYWICTTKDGAHIERHVYNLPLSQEVGHYRDLRSTLAAYRMVFGQPRQEDLVAFLRRHYAEEELTTLAEELRMDLSPPLPPPRCHEDEILTSDALRVDGCKIVNETDYLHSQTDGKHPPSG
ncbi:MAG: DEAD/DEAH box helicase [Verrucomicrobia bacterium]|nr:DEAD/DEAH box helicase [Verrucomicrobiota bacterium]MCH8510779.1 DEAD/DEAH box helicase [Kiritimatiellia bacterium]